MSHPPLRTFRSLSLPAVLALAAQPLAPPLPAQHAAAVDAVVAEVRAALRTRAPMPPTKVLVVGTFHFAGSRADARPSGPAGMLAAERQRQIAEVVDRLAHFAPTHVALEFRDERREEVDRQYDAFRRGELEPGENEIHQLGFRVAARTGLERVLPIDAPGRWYEPHVDLEAYAKKHGQTALLVDPGTGAYVAALGILDRHEREAPLREHLALLNSEAIQAMVNAEYLAAKLAIGSGAEYPAADGFVSQWHNRHLRIYARLLRLRRDGSERILVVIGAAHAAMLRHLLADSLHFEPVPVREWLGAAADGGGAVTAGPEPVQGQPWVRYGTRDALGREIAFYVTEAAAAARPLPLLVYVHGSGAAPHFAAEDGRIVPRNGHATVADAAAGRARALIVEKPGVPFLGQPGAAGGAPEFHREHTLPRWTTAIAAAIAAGRSLPGVAPAGTLVVGHSEGGLVAGRLAAEVPGISHVACLAAGGPTQLFDLVELARRGELCAHVSEDPGARADHVLAAWRRILAAPDDAGALFLGHSHRRWSSFLSTSTIAELRRSDARVFLAQGAADRAVTRASFEALRAELLAAGRDVTARLVEGRDHSFAPASPSGAAAASADGWRAILDEIVAWWLLPAGR